MYEVYQTRKLAHPNGSFESWNGAPSRQIKVFLPLTIIDCCEITYLQSLLAIYVFGGRESNKFQGLPEAFEFFFLSFFDLSLEHPMPLGASP